MKRFFKFVVAVLVVGLIVLWFLGRDIRMVSTEIEIAAPPEAVWKVLSDTENWENWNPIIYDARGALALDATLDMTMADDAGEPGARYAPRITVLDEAGAFRWEAKMLSKQIFRNEKMIQLIPTDQGTYMEHHEMFWGMMAPLMGGMLETGVRPMLERMNLALKEVVEGG